MSLITLPVRRTRIVAAASLAVLGALGSPLLASPVTAVPAHQGLGTSSLLQLEDVRAAGLAVDSATLGTRGDQYLGDAGRFDEGCLGEKTMRNITSVKPYPASSPATYADAVWTSTLDKEVWASESVAEGRSNRATSRYVATILDEIADVKQCEEDPAQGDHYGRAHRARVGRATATYFLNYTSDGRTNGGGVAVVRDGRRIGYVDLMSAPGRPGATLRTMAVAAARDLR